VNVSGWTQLSVAPAPQYMEHSAGVRTGRELLEATRPFAGEIRRKSRWYVISTFVLTITVLTGAGFAGWWPIRAALSVLGSLFLVRCFITYHDFMHGSLLRGSRAASIWFHLYAAFVLTPTRSWAKSHNYHHGHVGQISATGVEHSRSSPPPCGATRRPVGDFGIAPAAIP